MRNVDSSGFSERDNNASIHHGMLCVRGSLECDKRSQVDSIYYCCDETYVPPFWSTVVCKGMGSTGESCSVDNDYSSGLLGCKILNILF